MRLGYAYKRYAYKKTWTPVTILLILDINSEISEEHKLDIYKSFTKLILKFALTGKTNIVNKLKQSKDLQQLVAQFMKDGIYTESIENHGILIFQNV